MVDDAPGPYLEAVGDPPNNALLDWTSIVIYGDMSDLTRYGYSRDQQPGECYLTLGTAMLVPPYDIPIDLTVKAGNVNDQVHTGSI
jgi:hypothetical protein